MQKQASSRLRSWLNAFTLFAAFSASPHVHAHQQPTTLVVLDIAPERVAMNLHIPLTELELGFGEPISQDPQAMLAQSRSHLKDYLIAHIHPTTGNGQAWTVQVADLRLEAAEQTTSGPFEEAVVTFYLIPPPGASNRHFTLNYDVIMHQVVTHRALISIRNDWELGQSATKPVQVGVIRVNTETARIDPVEIHLGQGNWWAGFIGMVDLGIEHIKEGTDHLLFLLVLLLPATLLAKGHQWGDFGGLRYSLVGLLKIVTAFTIGHSITLLASALHWLRLAQQPVEVLIALSILVSAIHAIRPWFPGREIYVAAGFGLIHGLAFAAVLADLKLSAGPLALSILGFNLGIELMQLFVIAVIAPWLILLSPSPFYKWIRIAGSVFASVAAVGWIAHRITGQPNVIEYSMQSSTSVAPFGILILALLSVLTYFHGPMKQEKNSAQTEV